MQNIISNIVKVVKISFSKLKLLKSYLTSTMLQDRLNRLIILSIENEILELFDYKTLISDFTTKKTKRLV